MNRKWMWVVGVAAVLGACASKAPDQEYAGNFSRAVCSQLKPCCTANGLAFDQGQCEIGGAGFVQSGNDAAKRAGATFDQSAADACIAAVRTLAGQCKSGADDPKLAEPCRRVWVGTKAPGTACTGDVECAPGPNGRGACVAMKCAILTTGAKLGDVCSGDATSLADCDASDLQCDALGSKKCIALTKIGDPCGALTTCEAGAYCESGKCATKLAMGATCASNGQCASNGCIAGKCAANGLATSKPCNGT